MKHRVILTFHDLWDLFCRFHKEASGKDQGRLNWVNIFQSSDSVSNEERMPKLGQPFSRL